MDQAEATEAAAKLERWHELNDDAKQIQKLLDSLDLSDSRKIDHMTLYAVGGGQVEVSQPAIEIAHVLACVHRVMGGRLEEMYREMDEMRLVRVVETEKRIKVRVGVKQIEQVQTHVHHYYDVDGNETDEDGNILDDYGKKGYGYCKHCGVAEFIGCMCADRPHEVPVERLEREYSKGWMDDADDDDADEFDAVEDVAEEDLHPAEFDDDDIPF